MKYLLLASLALSLFMYHLGQLDSIADCDASRASLRCSYTESTAGGVCIQHIANTCEVYRD